MDKIKSILINNEDKIIEVLEDFGYCKFRVNGNSLSFAFDDDSNGSCVLNTENLSFKRWSTGDSGSIVDAVMLQTGDCFKEAINSLYTALEITDDKFVKVDKVNVNSLFGGFLGRLDDLSGENFVKESDLNKFEPIISTMFRADGIAIHTQDKYDIRYCEGSDRVIVPWRDLDNKLVGWNGRANYKLLDSRYKYITKLGFTKGDYLFGLNHNKNFISSSKYCIICEAEKSVMQSDTFGFFNIVAIGSSTIRKAQIDKLYNMGVRNIYIAYDEDVEYLMYVNTAMDIKGWHEDMNVYSIFDKNKEYLSKKQSITDNGEVVFNAIIKNCINEIK